jgi:hypothetical protein
VTLPPRRGERKEGKERKEIKKGHFELGKKAWSKEKSFMRRELKQ